MGTVGWTRSRSVAGGNTATAWTGDADVAVHQVVLHVLAAPLHLPGDTAAQGLAGAVGADAVPGVAVAAVVAGIRLHLHDQNAERPQHQHIGVAVAGAGDDEVGDARTRPRQKAQGRQGGVLARRAAPPAVVVVQGADTRLDPRQPQKRGGGEAVAAEVRRLRPEQHPAPDPRHRQRRLHPHHPVGITRVPQDFHTKIVGIRAGVHQTGGRTPGHSLGAGRASRAVYMTLSHLR